jgi:multidrug efflux system membrane fusion protein
MTEPYPTDPPRQPQGANHRRRDRPGGSGRRGVAGLEPDARAEGAAGGGPGGPGGGFGGGGRRGPASTVAVATATQTDLPVVIEALGTVTPAATVTVRPQVAGVITQVMFKEGQMVRAGQPLVQIDPRQFQMDLMQAQGNLTRDEAQLASAQVTLARYQTLLTQDSIARQEVDTQAATVKQLQGTVMADRAAVGTARLNVGYARIVAPVSGRVGLRVVDVGNYIGAGDAGRRGGDHHRLADRRRVHRAAGRRAAHRRAGQQRRGLARHRPGPNPDHDLDRGTFSTLDNVVDVGTGTVKAKARFANAGGTLFPSQFVNVRLELDTIRNAVVVPATALRQSSDGAFVWVLGEDQVVTSARSSPAPRPPPRCR